MKIDKQMNQVNKTIFNGNDFCFTVTGPGFDYTGSRSYSIKIISKNMFFIKIGGCVDPNLEPISEYVLHVSGISSILPEIKQPISVSTFIIDSVYSGRVECYMLSSGDIVINFPDGPVKISQIFCEGIMQSNDFPIFAV